MSTTTTTTLTTSITVNNEIIPESLTFTPNSCEDNCPIFKSRTEGEVLINYCKDFNKKLELENVAGVPGAFLIHNVLTPEECKSFIEVSEKMGYGDAPVSTSYGMVLMKEIRDNMRVIWDTNQATLQPIYDRVKEFLPPTHNNGTWSLLNLNERLRFYRYDPTQVFNKHFDGYYPRNYQEKSFMSFIVYLNDGMEGGHTTFYMRDEKIKVTPKIGTALVFMHGKSSLSPLHEGSPTKKGRKYVLRSDVMYHKNF